MGNLKGRWCEKLYNNKLKCRESKKWEEKQFHEHFKWLTWTWLRKENLNRETDSLLIAAQNNAIRTNHIKARIDKTLQNSKCWFCGHRKEMASHIINECSKLAQKVYETRHDWVGKLIPWEICKKFIFDHTNKWYMLNLESIWENETHKLLWDFEIQTNHLISARRPHLAIINNKKERTFRIVDFAVTADHRVKLKENEKRDKYLDLTRELKKIMEHESDDDTNYKRCFWHCHQRFDTGTGGLGKKKKRRVETIQITELLRLARIMRRVLETRGDLLSLELQWKTMANAGVENSKNSK